MKIDNSLEAPQAHHGSLEVDQPEALPLVTGQVRLRRSKRPAAPKKALKARKK